MKRSIVRKMLVPIVIAMLVQTGLFCGTMFCGGTIKQLRNNAFYIMDEKVTGRKNYIENEMVQRWSNLNDGAERVNSSIMDTMRQSGGNSSQLTVNSRFTEKVMQNASDDLIYMLRKNMVTGAFVVFEGDGKTADDGTIQRAGLYIRDTDPGSDHKEKSDLLVERAPAFLSKQMHISMDTCWSPCFSFKGNDPLESFYTKPFQAALQYPDASYTHLGYWSPTFRFSGNDMDVITYSEPLIENGKPYGVIGVEISENYLRRQLPYNELFADKKGAYVIGIANGEEFSFSNAAVSGPLYRRLFGTQNQTDFASQKVQDDFYSISAPSLKKPVYGCVKYLNLYDNNTPFENEHWVLMGVTEADTLLGFSNRIRNYIFVSLGFSLIIGLVAMAVASARLSRPIVALVRKVKESNPDYHVQLQKTNISEIDDLAYAIENLSHRVADTASKMSQILEVANVPIGVIEVNKENNKIFCTDRFLKILHLENECVKTREDMKEKLKLMENCIESVDQEHRSTIYAFETPEKSWANLRVVEDDIRVLGIAIDVTKEMQEKKRIEYERDYDILTTLPNRLAFQRKVEELFAVPEQLHIGAFVMLDLDNLKYINDTYGHDFGDKYICGAALTLKLFERPNTIVGRMSGDEFYLFFYGFESKNEVRACIDTVWQALANSGIELPTGKKIRVRVSGGVAWYPEDTTNYEQLCKYADFAMYQAKNTSKGEFAEFDRESYRKDAYLLQGSAELDKLIEECLVEYYFQPIVDVCTGKIFGYEALMRSRHPMLKSPLEILKLARSQSKLYKIEKLTFFQALTAFTEIPGFEPESRVFVNSISNQILNETDMADFESRFSYVLNRIVLEFTEEEKRNEEYTRRKRDYMKKWNCQFALDDYGAGYNGDGILLELSPDFIKVDTSIVRDIHKSKDKKKIFQNIASYARERGIKTVAEGVETKEELETLISCGADYVQGYYIGRPNPAPVQIPTEIQEEMKKASCERNL